MYLIYADESGDTGLIKPGGTPFYVISGLVVHENNWSPLFEKVVALRRQFRKDYGLPQRIALHATDIVNGHGDFHPSQYGVTKDQRFQMYRRVLGFMAKQKNLANFIHVFILKDKIIYRQTDVFERAWNYFLQRVHNTIHTGGELCRGEECSLIITDRTHDDHLRHIMRKMRAFNPVPGKSGLPARNLLIQRMLDDPSPRNSRHSYFVQLADLAAYALVRRDFPRTKLAPYKFTDYFNMLTPALVKSASGDDPQGIYYWPK